MNVSALIIWNESNPTRIVFNQNKQLLLPFCSQQWSIEFAKQQMWVMKYEFERIESVEYVESYKNCIQSKQTTFITSLLPVVVDWINKPMNASDEVLVWVHIKYWMSPILRGFYSIKTNNCFYLNVPIYDRLNQQKN